MIAQEILFADDFSFMSSKEIDRYVTHALCHEGEASFHLAGQPFRMRKGDCIVITHGELVTDMSVSDDFRVTVLYLLGEYALKNMPKNDYDVIGKLTLLRNPVLPLTEHEREVFMEDVNLIKRRYTGTDHHFHDELVGCLTMAFCLDIYDFHARIYENPQISKQGAAILTRFIDMLKSGEYVRHREVSYYASQLFITPKYLSEICKKTSGFSANFWISRFTITGITRLLAEKDLTLKTISDNFNFSSLPYFCRYVQNLLGVTPSEYREGLTSHG